MKERFEVAIVGGGPAGSTCGYELAKKGKDKPEVIKLVKKKFPEAKDKSISIWFKKALKDEAKES